MSAVHRMPRPGLVRQNKRRSGISSSKSFGLRSTLKPSRPKLDGDMKPKRRQNIVTIERDTSDLEDFSDSGSIGDIISNWNKSRSSASSKRIDHSNSDKSNDEERTVWTETSSLDSKRVLTENETTNPTETKEVASNTTKSFLRKNHHIGFRKKKPSQPKSVPDGFKSVGTTNSNAGRVKESFLEGHNGNAGDTKVMTVETITAEMERLKDMAQMMSEMNKRLSGENEAMMELMRSVQPRAKELIDQLRRERKEASDLKAISKRSTKDHVVLKSELNKLRVDLFTEKEKFSKLKSQVIQLRSQYVLKVTKLQQLKKNTKKLIDRYREFKEAHSMCGEEREMLRTKLVDVVAKFDKVKNIATQFQEGGNFATKLHELQHEKSVLQDEKARLETRVRDYEELEKRMKKIETDAKNMASDYEGDLERLRGLLEEKETLLVKLEKDQNTMRQENALLTQNVKHLREEHDGIKEMLESKDLELDDTKGRLSRQDENIRKLQDAYVQMTIKLSKDAERKPRKHTGTNTTPEPECIGKLESSVPDVTDRTYSLRKAGHSEAKEGVKFRNNNLAPKRDVWADTDERRTMRKVLRSSPVYESKSPGSTLRSCQKASKSTTSVLKQFDEETQTENSHRRVELPIDSSTVEVKRPSMRLRTLSRPISAKERMVRPMMIPRNATKNNNSSYRFSHSRQRIWRLCRAHDPVFQDTVPSSCMIMDTKDPIRFKLKSNPSKDVGGSLSGKLDKVFDAIRAQEDGIERLKSQLDTICESSQIDDNFSDEN